MLKRTLSEDEARRYGSCFIEKAGGVAVLVTCRCLLVSGAMRFIALLKLPFKVLASHLVEHHVKGFVELVQSTNHIRVNFGVSSPFRFAETSGRAAILWFLQTWKSFRFVEVKVFIRDYPLESQEVLHLGHLACRINNKPFPTDKVHLGEREVLHPALQVEGIYSYTQSAPRSIYEAQRPVLKSQHLKGLDLRLLGQSLCVVGDGSCDRITHHNDKLDVPGHGVYALWGMVSHKIAGRLLHGDLSLQRRRHQVSVNTDSRKSS